LDELQKEIPPRGIIQVRVVQFHKTQFPHEFKDSVGVTVILVSEDGKRVLADLVGGGGTSTTGYTPGIRFLTEGDTFCVGPLSTAAFTEQDSKPGQKQLERKE
jgi:hypothetical protein